MDKLKARHKEWLSYLQPSGIVVSASALVEASVGLDDMDHRELQETLVQCCELNEDSEANALFLPKARFVELATTLLEWEQDDLHDAEQLDGQLDVPLPDFEDVLSPDYALKDDDQWHILINHTPDDVGMDQLDQSKGWNATPQLRLERLLREHDIPIGLLVSPDAIRLVFAPRGESTGHMTFPIEFMTTVQGRLVTAAFYTLLCDVRLFVMTDDQRLLSLMKKSRTFQNEVSEQLANQVLSALHHLVRGMQTADERANNALLRELMADDPQHIYGGLLSVLLRLIFLLYAEDRGLMPQDTLYTTSYSIHALYERLRADQALHPDTMNQRFGAWSQLLTLFRLIHAGGAWPHESMPPRRGELFDPDTYAFLEGRSEGSHASRHERLTPPKVSDDVVLHVLHNLLSLEGEKLSYRTLDVEQIGSVYEYMMGFELHVAQGHIIAYKVKKLPVFIDLDALLALPDKKRAGWLKSEYEIDPSAGIKKSIKAATTRDDLVEAMGKSIHDITPAALPPRSLYLQPGEERRRSGSHYTPRALTAPIVRHTLEPLLDDFGPHPTPDQILGLKVCDPAMGSGAFLVETTRYLADKLVASWHHHNIREDDEEDDGNTLLLARRLVAQSCVYGVDKNPFAVDLAKLSLWLFTMARNQPFTFVDHALRHGDSLVGLNIDQLIDASWDAKQAGDIPMLRPLMLQKLAEAKALREHILKKAEDDDQDEKRSLLEDAELKIYNLRTIGDLIVGAFFDGSNITERKANLITLQTNLLGWLTDATDGHDLQARAHHIHTTLAPFHWPIEFPEVFMRDNAKGFDAFVGNPPFAGSVAFSQNNVEYYTHFLRTLIGSIKGKVDQCAYFFRSMFNKLKQEGTLGFIATNTISEGDTKNSGLVKIINNNGQIYRATTRYKWPGKASVVVSILHIIKNKKIESIYLDNSRVNRISAMLDTSYLDAAPPQLKSNKTLCSKGIIPGNSEKYIISNEDDELHLPIYHLEHIRNNHPEDLTYISPYVLGEDLYNNSKITINKWIIDPQKNINKSKYIKTIIQPEKRWDFSAKKAIKKLHSYIQERYLARARLSSTNAYIFIEKAVIPNEQVIFYILESYSSFSILSSSTHYTWATQFGSTMKDDPRYVPSRSFDPFPPPIPWDSQHRELEKVGEKYYNYREELMVERNEGLTTTYNRFHDPEDKSADIVELRRLRDEMDRAVLRAYGWDDIEVKYEWILLYELADGATERQPWRWQWPQEVHDEVLARLIALNAQRAREEKEGAKAQTSLI